MKRVRALSSEGMVRTSAALPEALHRRLMIESVETGLVATEIIRLAVKEWLDRHGKKRKRGGAR